MKIRCLRGIIALTALLVLAGCVQTKPVPGYARAGDIIVVGLGGVERNSNGAQTLKISDLSITITDSSNAVFDLTAQQVFKSYPDHAAFMNSQAIQTDTLALIPFDGGWFASVPLTTAGLAEPLPLAIGQATITVTSAKLQNTAFVAEGDLSSLPIEILPGQSSLDSDYLRQFISYAPTPNSFLLAPDDPSSFDDIAGAFLTIEYYDDSTFDDGIEPMIVPSSHNPYVQLSYNLIENGNGTGKINVILLNPEGFVSAQAGGKKNASSLNDLNLNLVYFPEGDSGLPAAAKTQFALDTAASYYIDSNGSVIEGLTPVLTHTSDL